MRTLTGFNHKNYTINYLAPCSYSDVLENIRIDNPQLN